jgi:hypothetical protein
MHGSTIFFSSLVSMLLVQGDYVFILKKDIKWKIENFPNFSLPF